MKTKAIYLTVALGMMLGFSSCDLNYFPSDELNSNALLSSDDAPVSVINGCYAMMQEEYAYVDPYESGNTYVRHYFQMAEFPADNTCLSGETSDHLFQAACYKNFDNMKNTSHLWWISYKIIFSANTVIEGVKEGESASNDQILGEAYFLRAMMHFNLVNLFGKPYVINNGNNPGVPLRVSTNTEETTRATVAEVYNQVVADLQKGAELMTSREGKFNPGYASKDAALGLLSRVYLYMGENQKVLDVIATMSEPTSNLDGDYEHYFANALTSKETLFACVHTAIESRGSGSIGSMYNGDGGGWGEVYPSAPLMNLYERYPQDIRMKYIVPVVETDTLHYAKWIGKPSVFFPYKAENKAFRSNKWETLKEDAGGKYCEIGGTRYNIKEKTVNGEYTEYYVTYDGEDCAARLFNYFPSRREDNPIMYITKFSYQDGDPQLSSPVFLRWAEIVLNRAEANAKLGNTTAALADVDAIRTRAGIPAAGMFSGNMHGYTDVLDIVLDERRMELAWEGHRMFDVYRNRRTMDRRFPGIHPWEEIEYTADKIQYPIPYVETSVSHIEQNPGY